MKFIHNYNDLTAFTEDYNGSGYTEPWVSFTHENNKVDYNKKELWLRVFQNSNIDGYTAEELEIINNIWDYWYVENPESIAYDTVEIEIRQPIKLYFVDNLVSNFNRDDPTTYNQTFTVANGTYGGGSGYFYFDVNDGNCLAAEIGAFSWGSQVHGCGECWNRCED